MTALADQASTLRALVRGRPEPIDPGADQRSLTATHRRALTVAVASGKGGVGKTTIAVNLAVLLARSGREVVLIDGDAGLGNADILLGLSPGPHLGDVIEGRRTLDEVLARPMRRLSILPGGSGIAWLADLDRSDRRKLIASIHPADARADVLLIDCSGGFGPLVLDLIETADRTLIVTTPEPTAVADAYALVKTSFRRAPSSSAGRFQLVVNEARSEREATDVHRRMAAVCERFLGLRLVSAGWIPSDRRVAQSVRDRRPMVLTSPRCAWAERVRCLSESITTEAGFMVRQARGRGLFARMLNRPGVAT